MLAKWSLAALMMSMPMLGLVRGTSSTVVVQEKEVVNKIGMRLVLVPAGKFIMGLPLPPPPPPDGEEAPKREPTEREETARIDEDAHEVEITQAFYMSKYEVTQAEYEKVMGVNPSHFRSEEEGEGKDSRLPVEKVSWYDAKEFCARLSKLEGKTYALPTEAEWEYACRAESNTTFYFGNTIAFDRANYDSMKVYPRKSPEAPKPSHNRTTPVGSFKENAFGLYDMHGNVFEWCEDWYSATYYNRSPAKDPPGPTEGTARVMRGGSWFHRPSCCRAAYRTAARPDYKSYNVGFRVVLRTGKDG